MIVLSGAGWRRTECVEAARTMAGERGGSIGERGDVGEREDALDGKNCGGGRRAAGRIMPASGVDGPEIRLPLGCWGRAVAVVGDVDLARLMAEGEARSDLVCRVSRERSSGISSRNSCLGVKSWSIGCDKGTEEEERWA